MNTLCAHTRGGRAVAPPSPSMRDPAPPSTLPVKLLFGRVTGRMASAPLRNVYFRFFLGLIVHKMHMKVSINGGLPVILPFSCCSGKAVTLRLRSTAARQDSFMSTTGVTYCLVLVSVVRAHASPGHEESRPTLVTRAGADGQATLGCYMPYIS